MSAPQRPLGGVAAGLALVLVAVLVGVVAQRGADAAPAPTTAAVEPTGHTTTVQVTAKDMRFQPDTITVPAGDRLVIELTNADRRRHDLVLATGLKTAALAGGATTTLDAGVIGGTVEGWCSLPGHRQAGMVLTITTTTAAAPSHSHDTTTGDAAAFDPMAAPAAGFTARDAAAPVASTGRLHKLELRVQEVVGEVAPGVRQTLWTFNGTVPGPVLRGRVGDTFEITLRNDGGVDHGVDFHAGALAPDEPMRSIEPGSRWSTGSGRRRPASGCTTARRCRCSTTSATACTAP
ncbi:cupredoxin domain-containing protein [Luedemannella flava]